MKKILGIILCLVVCPVKADQLVDDFTISETTVLVVSQPKIASKPMSKHLVQTTHHTYQVKNSHVPVTMKKINLVALKQHIPLQHLKKIAKSKGKKSNHVRILVRSTKHPLLNTKQLAEHHAPFSKNSTG